MKTQIKSHHFPLHDLKNWFLENARSLPWREEPSPYRVWISEIMLQQTQVSTVLSFFEKWMRVFPTIESLAAASIETVLKMWEGLGYYSRARFLHEAAQEIIKNHRGKLPSDEKALSQIKGIGAYTQGAILSFAFHKKKAAVDGNVLRVISRFFEIEECVDLPLVRKRIETRVEEILPDEEPWVVMEALIELGALICTKKPKCVSCPLKASCPSFLKGRTLDFPKKRERKKMVPLMRDVAVISFQNHYLLEKREKGSLMADLYEFPYLEKKEEKSAKEAFEKSLNLSLNYVGPMKMQKHTFTFFRATLFPHLFFAKSMDSKHLWIEKKEIFQLPFSSGHRKILNELISL